MKKHITKENDGINYDGYSDFGLTKLEYFAAMAMQGMLANSSNSDPVNQKPLSYADRHEIAELAVDQAKALIRRLNQVNT